MYEHRISMATLGGHGIGGKVALATACYHYEHVTGYFGLDSTPMNQYYHEGVKELASYVRLLNNFNIKRSYGAIAGELKNSVACPKWRSIFLNNLNKGNHGYDWNFNLEAINRNLFK